MTDYSVENWLLPDVEKMDAYMSYWNDEEIEKSKEWYVLDDNFSKMEKHVQESGLVKDFNACVALLKKKHNRTLCGTGIDLAAGNLWAVPYLLTQGNVERLYCLDYSKHRLLKLGPAVLEHYKIPKEAITLAYGSFYNINLPDCSLDFAFLSTAFHHADDPDKLLSEITRVLKPEGIIIIIGEHIVSYIKAYIRHMLRYVLSRTLPETMYRRVCNNAPKPVTLFPAQGNVFRVDPVLGDHYYTIREYLSFFASHNLLMEHLINRKDQSYSFVLIKHG